MNRREQIIFQILGLLIAVFGCIAAWLALDDIFSPPPTADLPTQRPLVADPPVEDPPTQRPPSPIMDNIYNSLQLETLVADKAIYTSGEEVVFSYKLTNLSTETLVIPENNWGSKTYHLVGVIQRWIERLGSDNNIPSISDGIVRDGTRYAAGGHIIDVERFLGKRVIEPAESIPFTSQLNTRGYPPGMYRYYVDYERIDGSVIHTLSLDFEIR